MRSPIPESADRLRPGARVAGKYRLARRIAVGGMGEVWRAKNEATGADVALKLARNFGVDVEARFRTEARLGSMLAHRSIVRIFDLVEDDDGSPVLVMELLRGESLARRLCSRGRLSTEQAVGLALPILSALSHAHAEGVVHRDVSPTNIILAVEPDGEVLPKLIDFGIAKLPARGDFTADGRVLGTPRYMSPEQIRGEALDPRADLFSLAVVLYEAISGVCPFAAASASASLASVLETQVDADPLIDPRVWYELKRALSKRPYERHADAASMAAALRVATGQTNAALAGLLRQAPTDREAEPWADAGGIEWAAEGTTPGGVRARARAISARALVAAAVAALLCVGLAGVVARHRSGAVTAEEPVAGTAHVPSPWLDRPVSAAERIDSNKAPTAAPAANSDSAPPVTTVPARPAKAPSPGPTRSARPMDPRLIGTTPGF